MTYEGRVTGDALQLSGLVREHGPDTLHRLLDRWGPEHTANVCIALAAAVSIDSTPQELWGWLGPVDNRMSRTVPDNELWYHRDPHSVTAAEINDRRPVEPEQYQKRVEKRRERADAAQTRRSERAA